MIEENPGSFEPKIIIDWSVRIFLILTFVQTNESAFFLFPKKTRTDLAKSRKPAAKSDTWEKSTKYRSLF